jgi:hypothetical protein
MTDILDLKGWKALSKTQSNGEEVIEAEYTIQPKACQKCGVIDRVPALMSFDKVKVVKEKTE